MQTLAAVIAGLSRNASSREAAHEKTTLHRLFPEVTVAR